MSAIIEEIGTVISMKVGVKMNRETDPLRLHGQAEEQVACRVASRIGSSSRGNAGRKRVVEDEGGWKTFQEQT